MAFTLEDGTGITDANALISVAEFDSYASDRNIDVSAYTEAQKQGAIVVASVDYCDSYFTFPGDPLNENQGMQIPTDIVPLNDRIKSAVSAATLLQLQNRLFVAATDIDRKSVTQESSAVGPVSSSKTYSEKNQYVTKYPTSSIDRILSKYAVSGGMGALLRG